MRSGGQGFALQQPHRGAFLAASLLTAGLLAASLFASALPPGGTISLGGAGPAVAAPPASSATTTAAAAQAAQEAYDAAIVDLLVLESRLSAARARLDQAREDARTLERQLTTAQVARDQAADDLAGLDEQRSERLRSIYKSRAGGWLEVLVESADLSQFLDRMFLLQLVVDQESDLAHQVAEAQAKAERAVEQLTIARTRHDAVVAEVAATETELEAAHAEQEAIADRLGARLSEARAEAAEARRRMDELNARAAGGGTGGAASVDGGAGTTDSAAGSTGTTGGGGSAGGSGKGGAESERPAGRQLTVKATAYALPGTTATGVRVRYGIVAVDPRVIPLGTRLWIPGYGEGIAADTGGAIKGNRIDVWLPTEREALDWGVKTVTITILD